jgi:DNA uptake protein ComE-like DNA-binding protein
MANQEIPCKGRQGGEDDMRRGHGGMLIRLAATAALCAAVLWLGGCSNRSDRQIREQAERATEQARVQAQKAAEEARAAAANATREANDVADGVRDGIHNRNGERMVNLNDASRSDLESLPGVSPATADRIAGNRPYATPFDLVRKRVISQAEFNRISGDVVTR